MTVSGQAADVLKMAVSTLVAVYLTIDNVCICYCASSLFSGFRLLSDVACIVANVQWPMCVGRCVLANVQWPMCLGR